MLTSTPPSPGRKARLLVALACALPAGWYAYYYAVLRIVHDIVPRYSDFGVVWYSAGAILRGANPYAGIGPGQALDYPNGQPYPITAILAATPFAGLPVDVAGGVFAALGVALLCYVITGSGWHRLPVLLSFPLLAALQGVQWSPLLTAGAIIPGLAWVLAAKPTIGAALVTYDPSWRRLRSLLLGGTLLCVVGFALVPDWPQQWLGNLRAPASWQAAGSSGGLLNLFQAPVACMGGPLILLALLRWRRPEARLTAALACVPQTMIGYELVPLLALVPETRLQSLALAALSWAVLLVDGMSPTRDLVTVTREMGTASVWLVFLPAVLLLLRRPNEGTVPAWLDAWLARSRLPDWLCGSAACPRPVDAHVVEGSSTSYAPLAGDAR